MRRAITEGLKNMFRTFWLSTTAITVLAVSLSSVALVASLRVTVGYSLRQLDTQVNVIAYFKNDVDQTTMDSVKADIEKIGSVQSVKFVSKDEAKQRLQDSDKVYLQQVAQTVNTLTENGQNPLQNSLEIMPTSAEKFSEVYTVLKGEKYVNVFDDVINIQEFVNSLQNIYNWTNILGITFVLIFTLVSILVMVNILRMAIYNHKDEIEIMRLVGATNGYIQGPFVAEGLLFSFLASLIMLLIFVPSITLLVPTLQDWLSLSGKTNNLMLEMYLTLGGITVGGILIGMITSLLATRRYLKS